MLVVWRYFLPYIHSLSYDFSSSILIPHLKIYCYLHVYFYTYITIISIMRILSIFDSSCNTAFFFFTNLVFLNYQRRVLPVPAYYILITRFSHQSNAYRPLIIRYILILITITDCIINIFTWCTLALLKWTNVLDEHVLNN